MTTVGTSVRGDGSTPLQSSSGDRPRVRCPQSAATAQVVAFAPRRPGRRPPLPRVRGSAPLFFFSPVVAVPLWLSAAGPPYTPRLPGGRQPLQRGQRGIPLYSRPRHLLTPSPPIPPVGAPLLHRGAAAGRGRPPHGSDRPSGTCGRCHRGGDREGAGGCERPAAAPPLRRMSFGGVEDAGRVTGVPRAAGGRGEGGVAAATADHPPRAAFETTTTVCRRGERCQLSHRRTARCTRCRNPGVATAGWAGVVSRSYHCTGRVRGACSRSRACPSAGEDGRRGLTGVSRRRARPRVQRAAMTMAEREPRGWETETTGTPHEPCHEGTHMAVCR